jgi:hypothetical protein
MEPYIDKENCNRKVLVSIPLYSDSDGHAHMILDTWFKRRGINGHEIISIEPYE